MEDAATRDELTALLTWYREMGVDGVVGEEPVDWLARDNAVPGTEVRAVLREAASETAPAALPPATGGRGNKPPAAARPPAAQPPPARRFPTAAPDEAVLAARAAAKQAMSLDALREALAGFDGCALKATAKSLCFYRGAEQAELMVIGDAPGGEEDREGSPFIGRGGQLLDKMIAAIGLDPAQVHITNAVYWRPPGNRNATAQEAQLCRPFLDRQIELVAPRVLLLLGDAAAKSVLNIDLGIMRVRGRWREALVGETGYQAMATLHPDYLLRTPAAKRLSWRDLLLVKAALQAPAAKE